MTLIIDEPQEQPDPSKTGKFPYLGGEYPIVKAIVMYGPDDQNAVLAVAGDRETPWHWLPCWWCNWYLSPITAGLCPYCGHQNDPTPYETGINTIDGQTVEPAPEWPQLTRGDIDNAKR